MVTTICAACFTIRWGAGAPRARGGRPHTGGPSGAAAAALRHPARTTPSARAVGGQEGRGSTRPPRPHRATPTPARPRPHPPSPTLLPPPTTP
jgi:hypothetical protein